MNKKWMAVWVAVVMLAVVIASGCAGKRGGKADPGAKLTRRTQVTQSGQKPMRHFSQEQLQAMVMNLADFITVNALTSGNDLFQQLETAEEQNILYGKVYSLVLASITIAISSDPELAYLNMLVMVTLERISYERYWIPEEFGDKGLAYLQVMRNIEQEVWEEADSFLTDEQQEILHDLINRWLKDNPDLRTAAWVRFTDFTDTRYTKSQEGILLAQGLLSEVTEATEAVDQARLLGERAMFLVTRIPSLVSWRTEITALHLINRPQIRQLLQNMDRASQAPDKIIATIHQLSEEVRDNRDVILAHMSAEREAAINQMMDRVASERQAILDSFAQEEVRVRVLLNDVERTLAAGEKLAAEIDRAAQSVDAVALRFGIDATRRKEGDRTTDPVTFTDVREYTREMTAAAAQMTTLVQTMNQTLESPGWKAREDEMATLMLAIQQGGRYWIDTAFIRALMTLVVFFAGMVVYRWMSRRYLDKTR